MEKQTLFSINKLCVSITDKPILHDIDLSIAFGSIHAIMGPNGSGKSTLALTLMGHPQYNITHGSILLADKDLTHLSVCERARNGLFLAFQHPYEIPGVSVSSFLREAYNAITESHISITDFHTLLMHYCSLLHIDESFLHRQLHVGFSGGEKKRLEILQLLVLKPKLAILDEIDSGLDIDALKIVAHGIHHARTENPSLALILITHYQRILDHITPDYIHIMHNGRIIRSGNAHLAHILEAQGYHELTQEQI